MNKEKAKALSFQFLRECNELSMRATVLAENLSDVDNPHLNNMTPEQKPEILLALVLSSKSMLDKKLSALEAELKS